MPAHRLVHVHGVQARRIEAGEPHVAHDDDPEGVAGVLEPEGQLLPPCLVADVRLPVERVGCRAGHDDLDGPLVIVVAVPIRPQRHDGVVEVHADAPAHADHHRLAVHRGQALLEVLHQVYGDQSATRRSAPTNASNCAQRLFSFSTCSISSPSVASSNSRSSSGRSASSSISLARRLS